MRIALLFSTLLLAFVVNAETLLVANRGGNTITLIDPATMESLGTVVVGADPHEIAISPDGKRAYVSNYGGHNGTTLSVVDIASRTKIKDISIAPLKGPHGITYNSGKVWFTADGSNQVGRVDPVTEGVDWFAATTQIAGHMLAVKSDGSKVYTANIGSGSVSIIDVATSTVKVVPAVSQVEGIALSPNERELWVGSRAEGGIAIIDLQTEARVATIGQGLPAYRLLFSNDGRFVVAPRGPQIVIYDAATREQVRAIDIAGFPLSVLFSPDASTLYVAAANPHRVHKINYATGQTVASVEVAPVPDGLAFAATPQHNHKKRRAVRKG
jgi:YVTN family beta-propeller protein